MDKAEELTGIVWDGIGLLVRVGFGDFSFEGFAVRLNVAQVSDFVPAERDLFAVEEKGIGVAGFAAVNAPDNCFAYTHFSCSLHLWHEAPR